MALITTPIDAVQWHTQPLTSQTVNAELWTPGRSATLSTPARRQVPFKCPPAPQGPQQAEISRRDSANPGTGVGRHPHPRSTSTRLGGPEYVARAPALQAPRRAALRGKLLLAYALTGSANPTLRRHSRWGGPSPATPRCSPSGDANGVRLPGAAPQLHPHCQGKRAQVRLAARAERPGGF